VGLRGVDNQGTLECTSNPCVDGNTDDALGCKSEAKCSSLYTTGKCASNALADNQGTIVGTSNLCVDGKVNDALLRAKGQIQ